MKPVALPPGRARLSTKPAPTGSATAANTIGKVWLICCNAVTARVPLAKMTSGVSASNSAPYFALRSALSSLQRVSILTLRPTCRKSVLTFWIVRCPVHEHADASSPIALFRAPRKRPCRRRTADERYELAPLHSITSSTGQAERLYRSHVPQSLRARAVHPKMIGETAILCSELAYPV